MEGASSTEQVLAITHEFLATWSANQIARLPVQCRPVRILEADDIALYAFELVREQCLDASRGMELQRMAAVFALASQRLSQLMANVTARDDRHWQQTHARQR